MYWKNHVLNLPHPTVNYTEIEKAFYKLEKEISCFTVKSFNVDSYEFDEFRKQFNPGFLYASGFRGQDKSYQDKKMWSILFHINY